MRLWKLGIWVGLIALSGGVARADRVCVGYDAQNQCTGWIDTGSGGYQPNLPGMPNQPNSPGSSCICAAYTANGTCSYYVNCSQ